MEEINDIVNRLLQEFIKDVEANARMQGKVTTGRFIRSMEIRQEPPTADAVKASVYAARYIWALDTGSAPARRRGTDAEREAFLRNLTEWCRLHNLPSAGLTPAKYRAFAKFLKWYIGKHGSWLYRNPAHQHKVIAPAVATLEAKLEEQVADAFTTTITLTSTRHSQKIIV